MCLEEFAEICRKGEMFDLNIAEKDVYLAFNLSMMTQVDELFQDRIFQMSFAEFIEAISRIAEKSAPQPYYQTATLTGEQRQALPLHIKLESVLIIMWKTFADSEVKAVLSIPKESLFKPQAVEEDDEEAEF
eukprot:TRINITY_DN12435_c0_g5_i1.p3 TRINITY_DN12435_c0_g5~~TRINITY_DN12435_c0_g5_i1.p3  ORF type:complete len:132 (-),score=30.67 TRINITY_DN12435_c0_g5_i1:79-474(-)